MVEKVIKDLRVQFVEHRLSSSIFCEALFYHISNTYNLFYEQNLDMSEHKKILPLGFKRIHY